LTTGAFHDTVSEPRPNVKRSPRKPCEISGEAKTQKESRLSGRHYKVIRGTQKTWMVGVESTDISHLYRKKAIKIIKRK